MESSPNDNANAQGAPASYRISPHDEKSFNLLAEALPEIVFTAEPDGIIDYFSARWGHFGGLNKDDPDYLDWSPRVHPEDLEGLAKSWSEAVSSGEIYEREFRLRSASGEYMWFYTRVIPVRDAQQKIVKWCGVTTDINERKEIELQLREVSRRKDKFLAMLGHELRNPLSAIKTSHDVMARPEASEAQKATAFSLLGKQIDHLSRLVDDTLDISRLKSGKLRLISCPVELRQLASDCCANFEEQAATSEIALTLMVEEDEIWVYGDNVRLTQCLANLLDNALKFTNPGGTIKIELASQDEKAFLQVTDSGMGMTAEEISRIFQPFEQGIGAQQLSTSGLGLGLAVIDSLVALHGGTISVASPGKEKGTTFRITLPLEDPPIPSKTTNSSGNEIGTKKILLLEDNESVALSLSMFFELEGHQVRVASNGDSALTMLEEDTPDILISDLTLPGQLSGWNIAEKVTSSFSKDRIPYLVALSGHTQPHHREKSFEAGFDEHLAKPPTPQQLRDVVKNGQAALTERRSP